MFNKILVALDDGDTCNELFQKAVKLAQATNAELLLLSVLTPDGGGHLPLPINSGLTSFSSLGMQENLWDVYLKGYRDYELAATERLRNFVDRATAAGVRSECKQLSSDVGKAICKQAKTWSADLVMVGSHGRKGLGEMLLGSVSNYVMHHAPCSVLVVHECQASNANATFLM
ncbi:MAG: universal stress protein [Cyanobacteria bacterium P01_B01_bin.77]